jgi:hypothetical protein
MPTGLYLFLNLPERTMKEQIMSLIRNVSGRPFSKFEIYNALPAPRPNFEEYCKVFSELVNEGKIVDKQTDNPQYVATSPPLR